MNTARSPLYYWRIWRAFVRVSIVREMEFRTNFILGIIRQLVWFSTFIIFIEAIFGQTDTLGGWSREEVLVVLALSRVIEGLMNMFFVDNLIHFTGTVNKGTFDFQLLKPASAQFLAAFSKFNFNNVGNFLVGIFLLGHVLLQQPAFLTANNLLTFIVATFSGIVIYYSLLLLAATLVFKLERLQSLWAFNSLFSEPLTVPFDVFPGGVRIALTYMVPLAFTVFVPAQALTNRLSWWQIPVGIGLATLFLLLANLAWRAGLRKYSSASS